MKATVSGIAAALFLVVAVAGCSDDSSSDATTTPSVIGELSTAPTTDGASAAPVDTTTAAPASPTTPAAGAESYTGTGATGTYTADFSKNPPTITVQGPVTVTQTQVNTVVEGTGPVVTENQTVKVNYLGVNGRDGKEFDSSYSTGQPTEFPLGGVVPGFSKAIAGQKVGSKVVVAVTPDDGYGPMGGQPSAGIEATDTLIFTIEIISAS